MPLLLAKPPEQYSADDQAQMRGALEREDKRNQKRGAPIILTDSDGARWQLVVDTSGNLSATAAS